LLEACSILSALNCCSRKVGLCEKYSFIAMEGGVGDGNFWFVKAEKIILFENIHMKKDF
jgi:hypothetical protein